MIVKGSSFYHVYRVWKLKKHFAWKQFGPMYWIDALGANEIDMIPEQPENTQLPNAIRHSGK